MECIFWNKNILSYLILSFRLQDTAIADNLSPVIWDNCLLGGTNTGRNQRHTSVSEDHWGPFPCTFHPSKEVFSTGSFFSSDPVESVQHLREDSPAWESNNEWPHFWDGNVPEMWLSLVIFDISGRFVCQRRSFDTFICTMHIVLLMLWCLTYFSSLYVSHNYPYMLVTKICSYACICNSDLFWNHTR